MEQATYLSMDKVFQEKRTESKKNVLRKECAIRVQESAKKARAE